MGLGAPHCQPHLSKLSLFAWGQLSGGPNGFGVWLPALVQSAKFLSCLPDVGEVYPAHGRWSKLDRHHESSGVKHCSPCPSHSDFRGPRWHKCYQTELSVPLVSYHEWSSKLEQLALAQKEDADTNPNSAVALRLLTFSTGAWGSR